MRTELLAVVGTHRLAVLADKPGLPYFTAACHEVQRCANIVGFLGSHISQFRMSSDRELTNFQMKMTSRSLTAR